MDPLLRRGVLLLLISGSAPGPGCASSPRGPGPAPIEEDAAAHSTWADGLDQLVFGEEVEGFRPHPGADVGAVAGAGTADGGPARSAETSSGLEKASALAVAAVREDRLEDAVPLLEEAVSLASPPNRWPYERALADTLLALGRSAEAARIYEGIVSDGTAGGAETRANLAAAYYRLGDSGRARSAASRALELAPGDAEAMKTLGLAEILEGNVESGAGKLRAALGVEPALPEALLALAEIEEEAGDRESALDRYRILLDLWVAAAERGTDPGRRLRGLFSFRPPAGRDRGAAAVMTPDELKARIERLDEGGNSTP